jgi:hypothetical protein
LNGARENKGQATPKHTHQERIAGLCRDARCPPNKILFHTANEPKPPTKTEFFPERHIPLTGENENRLRRKHCDMTASFTAHLKLSLGVHLILIDSKMNRKLQTATNSGKNSGVKNL